MSLTKYVTHTLSPPVLTEENIRELLAKALRNVQLFKPYPANTIYVTEAVQPCLRLSYFNRLYPQSPSLPTVLGEYLHSILQDAFKNLGLPGLRREVGLGLDLGDFKLSGRADIVWEDDKGNTCVGEIKTVGKLPNTPEIAHVKQLQTYMAILEAPRGVLIYVDRNRGRVKLFTVKPNPQVLKLVVENAKALWEALNNHAPPPAHRGAWCVFCPHRKRCKLANWESRRVTA